MTRHLSSCLVFCAVLLSACGPGERALPSTAPPAPAAEPWVDWLTSADARPAASELASRTARSVRARRARALALARLGDPDATSALIEGLRDPDLAVRSSSAMGLGALELEAPPAAVSALLAGLAAELDPVARGDLLSDLGRTGAEAAWSALTDGLAAESPEARRGACRGVAGVGLSSVAAPEPTLLRAAVRAADDPDMEVRLLCAHALGRALAIPDGALTDLTRAAADSQPAVRSLALRALGRSPLAQLDVLVAGAADPDPFVALAGLRALAGRADAGAAYAARLDDLVEAYLAHAGDVWTPVFLAALEAPTVELAAVAELRSGAARVHERLGHLDPGASVDRDRGLLHCAAARLADLGAGAPERTADCGLGQVPDPERRALLAEVLGSVAALTEPNLVALVELSRDENVRVREAAAAALAEVTAPEALVALRRLVADPDVGVRIAAVEAVGAHLARDRAALDDAALEALLSAAPTSARPSELDDALRAELGAALESFAAADDLEGLVTIASAIEHARDPALAGHLAPLVAHHNVAVRRRARAALEAADLDHTTLSAAPRASPPAPRSATSLALDARRATIITDRGTVVIELWPEVAPTTVARFVELAEAGTFDGLTFHRVVPGFVAQGGDPRGDGYGGPGWSQRCEDNRASYERGTVGMALAGRDTGGSQFFITITPQPHLDGRYTAFGRVTAGMDVVDRLARGDVMRSVRIEHGSPAIEPLFRPAIR